MKEKKVKVLFIQESEKRFESITKFLNIPLDEMEILSLKTKKTEKELSEANQDILFRVLSTLKPEVVITINTKMFHFFYPELTLKSSVGKLFEIKYENKNFILCPLFNPARFKHIGYTNEFKQLDNLKKYLMRNYSYGLITHD